MVLYCTNVCWYFAERDTTSLLLLAAIEEDDELAFLAGLRSASHLGIRVPIFRFTLESVCNEDCLHMFRFRRRDITRLTTALNIPDVVRGSNGTVACGTEALCILLRRLAYPNRLKDISDIFGRSTEELSILVNTLLKYIYEKFHYLLSDLDQKWLDQSHLQEYTAAVHRRGAPLKNVFGFIDGTLRAMCRPSSNQRHVYNGHKREHGIKFQSVVTPNGLVANMFGPFEGRRHDAALLADSGLLLKLDALPGLGSNGNKFAVYGDPAYPLRPQLLCPFRGAVLTTEQQQFNKSMSSVRESVEWVFGKIITNFAFLDFKNNLKLLLQPVGKYYLVGAIFTNCHTCLYGSQTSDYFDVQPPELEDYLRN